MAASSLSLPISSYLVIVKLTHDNFLLWKAQITSYFRGQNLFDFLDGSTLVPPSWQQQDQAITSLLFSSLSETLIAHVIFATTSHKMWLVLEELFVAKS